MRGIRRLFHLLLTGIIVAVVLVLLGFGVFGYLLDRDGPNREARTVNIAPNSGLSTIARQLVDEGFVESAELFKLAAMTEGLAAKLRFGEYEIPKGASAREILDILAFGKAIELIVTIPEGLSSYQIVARLNAVSDLVGEVEDIPPEGYLAPNSYAYSKGDSRQSVIDRMMNAQNAILAQAWENRSPDVPVKSAAELLILASLIEKETGNAEERSIVASVFENRLKKGMRLQTDPTVIYGITLGQETLGRGLRRSELERETPYNTYLIDGLPPTPIANPGEASIAAAANPAETDYLYFVAKTLLPSDGHVFANSLEEHNQNVAAYRKLEAAAQ